MSISPPSGGFSKLSGDLGPGGANTRQLSDSSSSTYTYYKATKPTLIMVTVLCTTQDTLVRGSISPDGTTAKDELVAFSNFGAGFFSAQGNVALTFFVPAGMYYAVEYGTSDQTIAIWQEAS